jgi:hypothetical protein
VHTRQRSSQQRGGDGGAHQEPIAGQLLHEGSNASHAVFALRSFGVVYASLPLYDEDYRLVSQNGASC